LRILGIDCGTERTGWGVIQSDGRRHSIVAHGVIRMSTSLALDQRLKRIAEGLRAILLEHRPEAAAVEGLFYAKNVKSALTLAHARGVSLLMVAEAGVSLAEYSPLEVKSSVVGYGHAEKHQVQMMVRSLTGHQGEFESEDASDALAVAICHATATSGPAARVIASATRLTLKRVAVRKVAL
jgi:crossover junction endodeoxyribonuclease RuvC